MTSCHNCGAQVEVPLRGKVGIRYCSDTCRPTCRADGCEAVAKASHQLCWAHYKRLRKYGSVDAPHRAPGPPKQLPKPCVVPGCDKDAKSLGLCNGHASAWRRANNPVICDVENCDRPVHAKNLCMRHYIRVQKFGDPEGTAWPTACPSGHPFTEANTRFSTDLRDGSVSRVCVTCHRSRQAKRRAVTRGVDAELIVTSEVMERDQWTCLLCGTAIPPDVKWPDPRFGTIDHRVPLALGGRHVLENVQAAHLRCNMSKNAKHPGEYDEAAFSHLWP